MPDFMDEAKNLASEHSDLVDKGLDQVEQEADNRTGDRFGSQLTEGEQQAENFLGVDPNNQQQN
jgi:hypothetical protein